MRTKSLAGFTLIELLITITIMMLLVGGGIAAYINFNERQQLRGSAAKLKNLLQSARVKARAGDRPVSCNRLDAYRVRGGGNTEIVTVYAVCDNGQVQVEQIAFEGGVVNEGNFSMQFQVLHGGVTNAGTLGLVLNGRIYRFVVNEGGEISQGDFVGQ